MADPEGKFDSGGVRESLWPKLFLRPLVDNEIKCNQAARKIRPDPDIHGISAWMDECGRRFAESIKKTLVPKKCLVNGNPVVIPVGIHDGKSIRFFCGNETSGISVTVGIVSRIPYIFGLAESQVRPTRLLRDIPTSVLSGDLCLHLSGDGRTFTVTSSSTLPPPQA